MANKRGRNGSSNRVYFLELQIASDGDCSHEIESCLFLGSKTDKPRQCIKKLGRQFADKGLYSQSYGFSSSHALLWELVHKESWWLKNWCSRIGVLEKTLESPLHCKEIKPGNAKGNQPWIFIGRTDAEAPILWPPDAKSWLIRKDPDVRKDLRQKEKRASEDEMIRWHHRLNGHEFEQSPGDSKGQGSLVCYSSWSPRVRHALGTELLQQQCIEG